MSSPASAAVVLLPTSDMVEIVRLKVPWSVFSAYASQYRDAPQWKLNKERLWRHKIDRHLHHLSDEAVFHHYTTTIKPRATRSDVGKARSTQDRGGGGGGQSTSSPSPPPPPLPQLPSVACALSSSPSSSSPFTFLDATEVRACSPVTECPSTFSSFPFKPLESASIGGGCLACPEPAFVSAPSSSSSSSSSYSSALSAPYTLKRPRVEHSLFDAHLGCPMPPPPRPSLERLPSMTPPVEDALRLMRVELQSLRRTLTQVSATVMEQCTRHDEFERRVLSDLALIRGALGLHRSAVHPPPAPPPTELTDWDIIEGVEDSDRVVKRQHVMLEDEPIRRQPLEVRRPWHAEFVPEAVLALLKGDGFSLEPVATPLGRDNALWAYGLTEPQGTTACESRQSIREHMRRESCYINRSWHADLLAEYDALVKGGDDAVDCRRFLDWKARRTHSAVCLFYSDRPHEVLNPAYLNEWSRALYMRPDGAFVALAPRAHDPWMALQLLLSRVCMHLQKLFNVTDTLTLDVTTPPPPPPPGPRGCLADND